MSINELAASAGVTPRTVRYYVTQGLVPSPGTRGKLARYGEEALVRVQLVQLLLKRGLRLAEQRLRLDGLSLAELRALLAEAERGSASLKARDEATPTRVFRPSGGVLHQLLVTPADYTREGSLGGLQRGMPMADLSETASQFTPSIDEVASLETRLPDAGPASYAPRRPAAEPWRRLQLAPGIELHVRADAQAPYGALLQDVLQAAHFDQGHWPAQRAYDEIWRTSVTPLLKHDTELSNAGWSKSHRWSIRTCGGNGKVVETLEELLGSIRCHYHREDNSAHENLKWFLTLPVAAYLPAAIQREIAHTPGLEDLVRYSPLVEPTPADADPWHIAHLGRSYFELLFQRCDQWKVPRIKNVWLGHMGVPFIEKRNGRHIHPNAMVECWDRSTWIFVGRKFVPGRYKHHNVTCWSYDTIAAVFNFPTDGDAPGRL